VQLGLLRRHLAERELIDDVLRGDQLGLGGQRQLETLELAVALLGGDVVAFEAVFGRELGERLVGG
jgi:hypothetical protein